MPRLLLFAPCEKVATDEGNNPVLISILVEWVVKSKAPIPDDAIGIAPQRWAIFALWSRLPGDEGKEFVQTCELKSPSGRIIVSGKISFRMTARSHRNTINIVGLPVNPGEYELSIYLSETDAVKDRELRGTYPLTVQAPAPAPAAQ